MPNQAASWREARTKEEKSQHVTEMIYKEASRKSKLYLQLLPILCSASYLLHNLFRKAFLNTLLQVKSWNRHLVIEQTGPRGSTLQRQALQIQDVTHCPNALQCSLSSTLVCTLLLQGQLGGAYPLPGVATYSALWEMEIGCLSLYLPSMLVRFVLKQTINKRSKHMSDWSRDWNMGWGADLMNLHKPHHVLCCKLYFLRFSIKSHVDGWRMSASENTYPFFFIML